MVSPSVMQVLMLSPTRKDLLSLSLPFLFANSGRRSSRGYDHSLTFNLDLGNQRTPTPCAALGMFHYSSRRSRFEDTHLRSNVRLAPSGLSMGLAPVKTSVQNLRFQLAVQRGLLALRPPMLLMRVSWLVKPATFQPGVACLFLRSLLALSVYGASFKPAPKVMN